MLQQTQAERVVDYFTKIINKFPTIESLAQTDYDTFFPYYKWLGYYSRARNMLKTAQKIVTEYNWVFPTETGELTTLAGIGPYTAEAIKAFAYDTSTLCFDTNLEKIFSRYYYGDKNHKLTSEEKSQILSDFQNSGISARDINNALMDYGATVSLNNVSQINWSLYPLSTSKFFETRGEQEPVKTKKVSDFPTKNALVFAIIHENHKVYFSDTTKTKQWFSPFFIGKNSGNPRAMIQEYFTTHHELQVSVRPPEVKSYLPDDTPYLVSYVQIQSGEHELASFSDIRVRWHEEGLVESTVFDSNSSVSLK